MATTKGGTDHPSYLVRQQIVLGASTAGANGTSLITAFPCNMRIRNVSAAVVVAGTSASTGHKAMILTLGTHTAYDANGVGTQGTATVTQGSITLTTNSVGQTGTSGDLNVQLNQGCILFMKNGTDATGAYSVTLEAYLDPVGGAWTAGN